MTYINPRAKALRYLSRVEAWDAGARPFPVSVEIDLSNRCDLGCGGCHFAYTHTRGVWAGRRDRLLPDGFDGCGDLLPRPLAEQLLVDLATATPRTLSVIWSGGGEPTLHPAWRSLVRIAKDCGFRQGLYTHGGLLTDDDCLLLSETLDWVVISLDAATAAADSAYKRVPPARFDAACASVRRLGAARNLRVGASFLLSAENWQDAQAMLELSSRLGATYAEFRPLIEFSPATPNQPSTPRAWIDDALPTLAWLERLPGVEIDVSRFLAYRDWAGHGYAACEGPKLTATVTPDGRVWMCPNRRGFGDRGSCLGDLRTASFAEIWTGHPGTFCVNDQCRVMCRLHTVNQALEAARAPLAHAEFI